MAGKKKRSTKRTAQLARRKLQSKQRKLSTDLGRLFALGPGGSPARPLVVPTAALVEPSATAFPCPLCSGRLRLVEHEVDRHGEQLLRVARCSCGDCGAPRNIWLRIEEPTAN